MIKIIAQALWYPVKNYQISLLLIIPLLLIGLMLSLNPAPYQRYIPFPEVKAIYLVFGICTYLGVVAVSIIVGLHRKIIYGDSGRGIRLIPSKVEITYSLYIAAMGVVIYLAVFALTLMWVALAVNLPSLFSDIPSIKSNMEMWLYGILTVPALAFLQILIRLYLSFPRVAIDQSIQKWPAKARKQTTIFSKNGAAILVILFLALALFYALEKMGGYITKPTEIKNMLSVSIIILIALIQAYTTIVLAAVLSLVYLDLDLPESSGKTAEIKRQNTCAQKLFK